MALTIVAHITAEAGKEFIETAVVVIEPVKLNGLPLVHPVFKKEL